MDLGVPGGGSGGALEGDLGVAGPGPGGAWGDPGSWPGTPSLLMYMILGESRKSVKKVTNLFHMDQRRFY